MKLVFNKVSHLNWESHIINISQTSTTCNSDIKGELVGKEIEIM
jgi:hypothetical protein